MKKTSLILIIILIAVLSNNLFSFQRFRVIFYYIKTHEGIPNDEKLLLKKAIERAILKHPKFVKVPDNQISAVFMTHNIDENGCTATECAIKIGKDSNINARFALHAEIWKGEAGYYISAEVIDVEERKAIWQPRDTKIVTSPSYFSKVAGALLREFGNSIPVDPRVKSVSKESQTIIVDIGGNLGIKKGQKYEVILESQFESDQDDIEVETLGTVRISLVMPQSSKATIINGLDQIIEGAKLKKLQEEVDDVLPIIKHNPIKTCSRAFDVDIEAEISDNQSVKDAFLFFRVFDLDGKFEKLHLRRKPENQEIFTASIKANNLQNENRFYYYIEAIDEANNKRIEKDEFNDPFLVQIITIDTQPPNIVYERPKEDRSRSSNSIIFTTNVRDNVGIKEVIFKYKFNKSENFLSENMKIYAKETNTYGIEVDISLVDAQKILYFIEAVDLSGNRNCFPIGNEPKMEILRSKDISPPQIHYINFSQISDNIYEIRSNVSDNVGVKNVRVKYGCNEKSMKKSYKMNPSDNDWYSATIDVSKLKCDNIIYVILAKDVSGRKNMSTPRIERIKSIVISESDDITPPKITYFNISAAIKTRHHSKGKDVIYPILVTNVEDNIGIADVKLFIRSFGDKKYKKINLSYWNPNWGDFILESDKGIEYYFVATDVNNNKTNWGYEDAPVKLKEPPLAEPLKIMSRFKLKR